MAVKARATKVGLKALRATPGKRRSARAGVKFGARRARSNPYLQALVRNRTLHRRLLDAYGSARVAYGRMSRRRGGASALVHDKKARRALGGAAVALRDAAAILRGAKKKRRRARRLVAVALIAATAAAALSAGLRQKVVGLLFGPKHESDQTGAQVEAAPFADNDTPVVEGP